MEYTDMAQYLLIERGCPELFVGGKGANILFLGQDPTIVSSRHIPVVLDLKRYKGRLYKYIVDTISRAMKIRKENILAWNLVNRYFLNKPRIIAENETVIKYLLERFPQLNGYKNDWKTVRFLYHYFQEFGELELKYILRRYKPRALITLGEPVFRVIRSAYALPQHIEISDNLADFCCERIDNIKIGDNRLVWLALPHEPTGVRNPHYKKVLEEKLPLIVNKLKKNIVGNA